MNVISNIINKLTVEFKYLIFRRMSDKDLLDDYFGFKKLLENENTLRPEVANDFKLTLSQYIIPEMKRRDFNYRI